MKVFVYGSLKRGFGNNRILQNSEFICKATLPGIMLSLGYIPGIVYGNGVVHGEIYEVDKNTLNRLDLLEGHPRLYIRKIRYATSDKNTIIKVFVYFLNITTREHRDYDIIKSGIWEQPDFDKLIKL